VTEKKEIFESEGNQLFSPLYKPNFKCAAIQQIFGCHRVRTHEEESQKKLSFETQYSRSMKRQKLKNYFHFEH
jgi:hypothetical protein